MSTPSPIPPQEGYMPFFNPPPQRGDFSCFLCSFSNSVPLSFFFILEANHDLLHELSAQRSEKAQELKQRFNSFLAENGLERNEKAVRLKEDIFAFLDTPLNPNIGIYMSGMGGAIAEVAKNLGPIQPAFYKLLAEVEELRPLPAKVTELEARVDVLEQELQETRDERDDLRRALKSDAKAHAQIKENHRQLLVGQVAFVFEKLVFDKLNIPEALLLGSFPSMKTIKETVYDKDWSDFAETPFEVAELLAKQKTAQSNLSALLTKYGVKTPHESALYTLRKLRKEPAHPTVDLSKPEVQRNIRESIDVVYKTNPKMAKHAKDILNTCIELQNEH